MEYKNTALCIITCDSIIWGIKTAENKRKYRECLHDAVHGFASSTHNHHEKDKPTIKDASQMRVNVPTRLRTRKTVFSPGSIMFMMQCKGFLCNQISIGNIYMRKNSWCIARLPQACHTSNGTFYIVSHSIAAYLCMHASRYCSGCHGHSIEYSLRFL